MDFDTMIGNNWSQIKGKVRQKWSKLTDEDTDISQGDFNELSEKIQNTYGLSSDKVEEEFRTMLRTVPPGATVNDSTVNTGTTRNTGTTGNAGTIGNSGTTGNTGSLRSNLDDVGGKIDNFNDDLKGRKKVG